MDDDQSDTSTTERRGGARAGAGRPKNGAKKAPEVLDFDRAKARNESAKANLNELNFKVESGQYISRVAVQQASAKAVAGMTQSLRSIADALERKGVPADVCSRVEDVINDTLESLSLEMEMMTTTP